MPLRMTRPVNSVLYVGRNLNINDLEGSYSHKIWIRRVRYTRHYQDFIANIASVDGVIERILSVDDPEPIELEPNVVVQMVGIGEHWTPKNKYCEHCGKGYRAERMIPQIKLSITAPKQYKFVRNEARRKT